MKTLLFFFSFLPIIAMAQVNQSVKGRVIDNETQISIFGARVQVFIDDTTKSYLAVTNIDGEFSIKEVPVGKHQMRVSYIGYESSMITIIVISGRETVQTIYMQERANEMSEVIIQGRNLDQTLNEMAIISATQFSIEETEIYAGSRADPARMASNFAGVQGADDSRNDIVIRGNSPLGLLWRVEGVDIPNPNHFSVAGSTGGPVSEGGFNFREGIAIVPEDPSTIKTQGADNRNFSDAGAVRISNAFREPVKELNITPELRQQGYDNKTTQDDHGMHITGLFKEANGEMFYLVKNSWGTSNHPKGYLFVSQSYFKYKTINIYLHKDGLPSDVRKKLRLE